MAKKFAEHNGLNLTQTNNDVLAAWEKNDIFHKSIDEREGCPQFIFFEGPPSANGHPGIHHVLATAIFLDCFFLFHGFIYWFRYKVSRSEII